MKLAPVKTVLVTGGARGIGAACVAEFLACGWRVLIGDVLIDEAKACAAHAPDRAHPIELDVANAASIDRAFELARSRYGRLDALINNAGIQRPVALEDPDWSAWDEVMAVNLNGAARCMSTAARMMIAAGSGCIVNVVSVSAARGQAGRAPYAASKAALVSLTRTGAVEWAARGVRVNAVGPGYVETALVESALQSGRLSRDAILERTPLNRLARPREVAAVIRFLASDEASFITGQTLYVDGGFLADFGVRSRSTPAT
jgi:NAD(P)-dependent dehydrogenase (short-subunit alcohol dehydrogenase family)